MSKQLDEEQNKYGEFYSNLKSISQAKQDGGMDMESAKSILNDYKRQITFRGLSEFWKQYEADTPEETETLEICKNNIKQNMKICGGAAYLVTLAFTGMRYLVIYAQNIPVKSRFFVQVGGTLIGSLYGIIISNKPNMSMFYMLGPQYNFGRIARDEILQWSSEEDITKKGD